jgi:hypothetical protein
MSEFNRLHGEQIGLPGVRTRTFFVIKSSTTPAGFLSEPPSAIRRS